MATKIQLRHDSSNKWVEINPILLPGEIGIELDTKKFKIGDGSTDWNNLQYAVSGSGEGSSVEVDGNTIILNTDGTISSNAVIDQNIGNAKTWTGTLAEYNLIKEKDSETLYYITDDIVEADTVITLDSDLNGLSEVGQAKFDVKANKDEVYTKEESYNKQEVDEAIQDATKNAGGGLEIGDIGIAPLGIDETKGKRRYLNGQVIIQEQYVEFTNKVKSAVALYPSLACTESEWQTTATMTVGGQVGKFVVDNDAGTIRLPKIIMPIQGLTDLSKLGEIVEAGLPNITGSYKDISYSSYSGKGAFKRDSFNGNGHLGSGTDTGQGNWSFNASLSNPIYGNSNTVQQEQIQYPYFIQVATGAETEDNIINEIELNNPYSFGDSKYSPVALNNLSWLKSEGQYNSKAIYPAYYDWLLKIYNGVEIVEGVSVKLSTEDYTDYDWVLNTAEETFRLPLLDGSESLPNHSNPIFLDNNVEYTATQNGFIFAKRRTAAANTVNAGTVIVNGIMYEFQYFNDTTGAQIASIFIPVTRGDVYSFKNVTGDSSAREFISARGNGSLYFYVGETVQNANLINAGRIEEKLTNYTTKSMVDGQWIHSNHELSTATAVGTYTIDINDYLPQDGHCYEILFNHVQSSSNSTASYTYINSEVITKQYVIALTSSVSVDNVNTFVHPVGLNRTITKTITGANCSQNSLAMRAYRRLGTNQ